MLERVTGKNCGNAVAALLLLIFLAELAFSVRQQSLTWDEDDHIFAGYMSWKTADFGFNPEHPPLVKALAAIPLLPMNLKVPPLKGLASFKDETYFDGRDLIFGNGGEAGADRIIFRARMAAAALSLALGLLVFLAAREMFGVGAALFALTLLVLEPNIIAVSYTHLDVYKRQKFSFTFQDPGTYEYFCSVHPKMTGKIIVKPAAAANRVRIGGALLVEALWLLRL